MKTDASQLAVNGGSKVRTTPFPKRRLFGEEEKQVVVGLFDDAIRDGHEALGYNGPQEGNYCREFADFLGGGFADGVNSGTSAVYVALRALEIEPFSEVILPPITDPGGAMPVPLQNLIPVPADCAPGSYNTDAERIAERITERTKAIIVAHIAGIPVDLDPVLALAKSKGIPVIEDCAQSHGATYHGRQAGSFGTIAAFSTMFGKHHATGGQGGIVFAHDEELYWRIRRYADRGKPFGLDPGQTNVVATMNLNMDELHAAIGRVQLSKLPHTVQRRRTLARIIGEGCDRSLRAVRLTAEPANSESVYWFLLLKVDLEQLKVTKQEFVQALGAEGLPIGGTYLHTPSTASWWRDRAVFGSTGLPWTSPLYKGDPDQEYPLPNALATDACHMLLYFHEDWTDDDARDVVTALEKVEGALLR